MQYVKFMRHIWIHAIVKFNLFKSMNILFRIGSYRIGSSLHTHDSWLLYSSEDSMSSAAVLPLSPNKFALLDEVRDYSPELTILDVCRLCHSNANTPSHSSWPISAQDQT